MSVDEIKEEVKRIIDTFDCVSNSFNKNFDKIKDEYLIVKEEIKKNRKENEFINEKLDSNSDRDKKRAKKMYFAVVLFFVLYATSIYNIHINYKHYEALSKQKCSRDSLDVVANQNLKLLKEQLQKKKNDSTNIKTKKIK